MDNFNDTFVFEPYKQHDVMHPDYKPELDNTGLCTDTEKAQFWKYIGEMQWSVALGWIYISCMLPLFSRDTDHTPQVTPLQDSASI